MGHSCIAVLSNVLREVCEPFLPLVFDGVPGPAVQGLELGEPLRCQAVLGVLRATTGDPSA